MDICSSIHNNFKNSVQVPFYLFMTLFYLNFFMFYLTFQNQYFKEVLIHFKLIIPDLHSTILIKYQFKKVCSLFHIVARKIPIMRRRSLLNKQETLQLLKYVISVAVSSKCMFCLLVVIKRAVLRYERQPYPAGIWVQESLKYFILDVTERAQLVPYYGILYLGTDGEFKSLPPRHR